jgi:hypothetical protein
MRNNVLGVPAQVADHVEPHQGDQIQFWFGKLQSLCKPCHDSRKRYTELNGFDNTIGIDGWPTDPKHPVYTGKLQSKSSNRKSKAQTRSRRTAAIPGDGTLVG